MIESNDVYYCGESVGKMQVNQEGLYYQFTGKFKLKCGKFWRIVASSADRKVDLGLCLYEAPHFTVNKRLPIKRFCDNQWSYAAVCPTEKVEEQIVDEGPFEKLQDVEKSRIIRDADRLAILLDGDH